MATSFKAGIDRFSRRLASLDRVPKLAATDLAEAIRTDIGETFASEQEPGGRAWRPRKHAYPWPMLDRSGALKASLRVLVRGGDVVVRYLAPYARWHQSGTRTMAQRKLVPDGSAVPRRWLDAGREAIRRFFHQAMGR